MRKLLALTALTLASAPALTATSAGALANPPSYCPRDARTCIPAPEPTDQPADDGGTMACITLSTGERYCTLMG